MLAAAQTVEDIVLRVSSAAQQLSRQIDESSKGAAKQQERATRTAIAMNQINATVADVAQNASSAASDAESARERATSGNETVIKVESVIQAIRDRFSIQEKELNGLSGQVEGIASIMVCALARMERISCQIGELPSDSRCIRSARAASFWEGTVGRTALGHPTAAVAQETGISGRSTAGFPLKRAPRGLGVSSGRQRCRVGWWGGDVVTGCIVTELFGKSADAVGPRLCCCQNRVRWL